MSNHMNWCPHLDYWICKFKQRWLPIKTLDYHHFLLESEIQMCTLCSACGARHCNDSCYDVNHMNWFPCLDQLLRQLTTKWRWFSIKANHHFLLESGCQVFTRCPAYAARCWNDLCYEMSNHMNCSFARLKKFKLETIDFQLKCLSSNCNSNSQSMMCRQQLIQSESKIHALQKIQALRRAWKQRPNPLFVRSIKTSVLHKT